MKFTEAKEYIFRECGALYDEGELTAICWRILEHLSGKRKMDILLDRNIEFDFSALEIITEQLKKNIPVQYVLGYEWFGNLKLKVNENVLIPRPETEELCRLLIKKIKANPSQNVSVIDIGTGSGCIPVLVKKEIPEAEIYAIDISEKALEVAKENTKTNNVDAHFIHDNILDTSLDLHKRFDFIISNPPYILPEEKKDMHERVFTQEPAIALFVTENDPLEFYKAIIFFAKKHLKENGSIYFELNNLYASEIKILCENDGYVCEVLKDMYGNERFAVVH